MPVSRPVNVALLLSPAGTRSPLATPPVTLVSDHKSADTFATKLLKASRVIANTVSEFPAMRFCAGTTAPKPFAKVSTRTRAAPAATTVSVCVAASSSGVVLVMVASPASVALKR